MFAQIMIAATLLTAPTPAQATPELTPIADRGVFTLTDAEWDVLWQVQQQCHEVTDGLRTSTTVEIDAPRLLGKNDWTYDDFLMPPVTRYTVGDHDEDRIDTEFKGYVEGLIGDRVVRIMKAIHFIAPSTVDWSNRYGWIQIETQWAMDRRDGTWHASITSATASLPVCIDFSTGVEYEVDQGRVQRIRDALDRAQEIANRHAGEPARTRLESYASEISDLRSYSSVNDRPYTHLPWCFTSVFDGNPDTGTVCEGFTKSLVLLTELSGQHDVSAYAVAGKDESFRGLGSHMWSVNRMPDGKNYLTDMSNNFPENIGNGELLLTTTNGTVESGYTAYPGGNTVSYYYDDETLELYTHDALALSGEDYVEPVAQAIEESHEEMEAEETPQDAPVATEQDAVEEEAVVLASEPAPQPEQEEEERKIRWSIPVVDNREAISIDHIEMPDARRPETPAWFFASLPLIAIIAVAAMVASVA